MSWFLQFQRLGAFIPLFIILNVWMVKILWEIVGNQKRDKVSFKNYLDFTFLFYLCNLFFKIECFYFHM